MLSEARAHDIRLGGSPLNFSGRSLQALTAAALLLPGVVTPLHAAEPGTLNVQVSRYEEGRRDLFDVDSRLAPLRADSLHLSGAMLLRNGIRANVALSQDTWSGATPVAVAPLAANGNRPILRNSSRGLVFAGASPIVNGRIALTEDFTPAGDARAVQVMSSASPELRRQADVGFEFPVDSPHARTLTASAGISDEPDYRSRYGRLGARIGLNDNLTTLSANTAFTRSDTHARLDADLQPYVTRNAYAEQLERGSPSDLLRGERRDRGVEIGVTQVLDAVSVLDAGIALNRASGFMENPYKVVTVVFAGNAATPASGDVRAFLEQRPDERRQLTFRAHYARHFAASDATLQLDYVHSRDDWGIATHSVELGWAQTLGAWTVTPRLRYYTQGAADFHVPWLLSRQNFRSISIDENGEPQVTPYSAALLPAHFSSDHRLASFGSASAGLTLQRRFAVGLVVEGGVEYYTRADGLHAGGGENGTYADFDFAMANIALTLDLGAAARRARREATDGHGAHAGHASHGKHPVPAGLMFTHAGQARGSFMTGYRASHQRQYGALLHGTQSASDDDVATAACNATAPCRMAPARMTMTMHMLDLMYAVNDTTTLMLMPQYMTMDMRLRRLAGAPMPQPGAHDHDGRSHTAGGLGDTLVAGLFTLHASATHGWQASLGVSVPTGSISREYRRTFQADGGLVHYDMQGGSGTWDLVPSLTWQATRGSWHSGVQVGGIRRLQSRNASGYRLGDQLQLSAWTLRTLNRYASLSLRAQWQRRGAIDGAFDAYNAAIGPMDFPDNHGGDFIDVGFGLNLALGGSGLALEWFAPVDEDVNGFQLERHGALAVTWHYSY
ncbi:MAG TPA: DUF3570 domain-containing protein [Pseudomonadales bacterium]